MIEDQIKIELWRAVVTAICSVLPFVCLYLVALLRKLAEEVERERQSNMRRDRRHSDAKPEPGSETKLEREWNEH